MFSKGMCKNIFKTNPKKCTKTFSRKPFKLISKKFSKKKFKTFWIVFKQSPNLLKICQTPNVLNLRKLRCIPRSPPSRPGSRARRGLASPHAAPRRQAHPCLRSCPRPSARRSRSSSAPRLQEHWNLWKSEKYFFLKFDRSQHLSMHPFLPLDNPTGQFLTENRVARRLPSQSAGFIFRCLPARFARKKFRKIPTICQRVL